MNKIVLYLSRISKELALQSPMFLGFLLEAHLHDFLNFIARCMLSYRGPSLPGKVPVGIIGQEADWAQYRSGLRFCGNPVHI
jgi:hypothetical protein